MELWVMKALQSWHTPVLDGMMQACSFLAEELVLLVIIAAIYWCLDKKAGQIIIASMLLSLCFNCGIKNVLQLPRPFALYPDDIRALRVQTATGYSFPSGHTQGIATFAASCALVFQKRWIYIVGTVVLLLVGFSRVYLGVHFPHDVLFGAVFGIAAAVFCVFLMRRVPQKKWGLLFLVSGLLLAGFIPFSLGGEVELDYFKALGALYGFVFSLFLEERLLRFHTNITWKKKLIRGIIGFLFTGVCAVVVALAIPWETAFFCAFRMAVLVFCMMFIYPLIFVKLKF